MYHSYNGGSVFVDSSGGSNAAGGDRTGKSKGWRRYFGREGIVSVSYQDHELAWMAGKSSTFGADRASAARVSYLFVDESWKDK